MKLKKLLLSLPLVASINLFAADSNSIKHYSLSAVFGFASETILHKNYQEFDDIEKIAYATALGSLPGLAKELKDDSFSNEDMAFNVVGALSGAILSNYVNNNTTIFVSHDEKRNSTQIKLAYNF